ncbi:ZN574 protein, partial [Paradoxornis webbianus]|nr:ZN574 protein [Sinosuthora webbiana]
LFQSQELWLAHRQGHRSAAQNPPQNQNQSQSQSPAPGQARVDVEHSYRKPEDGEGDAAGAEAPLQLLLYECGECLQLFQSPKDFL